MACRRLMLALALVVALVGVAEASRELLGPYPYVQCGGKSGCTGAQCRVGPWPNFKCTKAGFHCFKVNSWYWQCDSKQPPMNGVPTPTPYVKSDFHQCGGSGNGCKGTKCADKAWPQTQGGACKSGLKCYKISCAYWQCDTHQPPKEPKVTCPKPAAPTKAPCKTQKSDFKQCGGKGNGCKGTKCKDARWPLTQGGNCSPCLKCYRKSEWYYACDTHP